MEVTLRPATAADAALLASIGDDTRDDLLLLDLDEAALRGLLDLQRLAQEQAWSAHFEHLRRFVVLVDGAPVGRVYLDDAPDEVTLVDLAVRREHRGRGVGTAVLELLRAVADARREVLRVRRGNAAERLYARAGFVVTGGSDTHLEMARHPDRGQPKDATND